MNRRPSFHKGRWRQARERLHIADAAPPKTTDDPVDIAALLPRLLKKLGLESTHWLAAMNDEWPTLVGEAVARHTRPGRMDRGRLIVFVDSSIWLNELSRYGRKDMLNALRQRFGQAQIKDVSLQLDPDGIRHVF